MLKLFAALALAASLTSGQVIDASRIGKSVSIDGDCKFKAGDDLNWAKPDFDDSAWRMVTTEKSWREQGLGKVRQFYWYRFHVQVPPSRDDLSVLFDHPGPYELFADGKRLGGAGRFLPAPVLTSSVPRVLQLPPSKSGRIVIALRAWAPPQAFRWSGLSNTPQIGTKDQIAKELTQAVQATVVSQLPDYVLALAMTVVCCGLLVIFFLQRDHSEYVVLALVLFVEVITTVMEDYIGFFPVPVEGYEYPLVLLSAFYQAGMIEFAFRFLRQPVPVLMRVYQCVLIIPTLVMIAYWSGWLSSAVLNTTGLLISVPFALFVPGIVLWRFYRGNREAGLLAIPLCLVCLNDIMGTLGWSLYELHLRPTDQAIVPNFEWGIVEIDPDNIFLFLFLLSVAALVLYRFQRVRGEQVRATAELEAARTMQEVMVPAAVSATGFLIESAYIPAQEVGGDFFQLFPSEKDGSLLVVIGDVSGKGMKAAMLVSMILGLIRRTVDQTRSPGRVLCDLNRLLVGHTDDKFATCCCALLTPDGVFVGANAGHLSPYCDGQEIELPGGLPLGLALDADYKEVRLEMPPGKRWVFLSDGVIEARSKSGELYGFERARVISIEAVSRIAEIAQQFGQEDDITVLGIEARALAIS